MKNATAANVPAIDLGTFEKFDATLSAFLSTLDYSNKGQAALLEGAPFYIVMSNWQSVRFVFPEVEVTYSQRDRYDDKALVPNMLRDLYRARVIEPVIGYSATTPEELVIALKEYSPYVYTEANAQKRAISEWTSVDLGFATINFDKTQVYDRYDERGGGGDPSYSGWEVVKAASAARLYRAAKAGKLAHIKNKDALKAYCESKRIATKYFASVWR